jgi:copper oxidase (laccase) domain-containing protein
MVRVVTEPGEHDGAVGDAAITRCRGAVLSVWVADCAPVVLLGGDRVVGVVHAGWRGALDGVLHRANCQMGQNVIGMRRGARGGTGKTHGP